MAQCAPDNVPQETLRTNVINAQTDVDNSNILRYTAVGIMGAGLVTSIVGTVMLAGAPSGSRFERRAAALIPRVAFTPQHLQLGWSF
jgi:hypothetical protein